MGEKHTKGPWVEEIDPDYLDQPSGWIVGVVEYAGCGSHEAKWTSEANKRLALSAPDLLGDGQFLLDRLDEFANELQDDEVARQFYGHVAPALARLRASTNKATGATDAQ